MIVICSGWRKLSNRLRILEQAVEQFPEEGETMGKVPESFVRQKAKFMSAIESPRGEIGCHIVSKGKAEPYPSEIPQTFLCESANFAQAAGR